MTLPSLLRRLVLWQVCAMAVAWLALSAWLLVMMLQLGNGDLDHRMTYLARTLAEAASAAGDDPVELTRRLRSAERIFVGGVIADLDSTAAYVPRYRVRAADGRILYATPGLMDAGAGGPPGVVRETTLDGRTHRIVGVLSDDGRMRVDVEERTDERLLWNFALLRTIGVSQLLILTWCLGVMAITARRGFRPLKALAAALSGRAPGDLTPVTVAAGYQETAPIVEAINDLLAREGRRLEVERGFLADAAHELRTPLAALAAQTHLLLTAQGAEARDRIAVDLNDGLRRVSHLMSQLLTLARADSPAPAAQFMNIDVAELCRERLAALTPLARRHDVDLTLCAPEALCIRVQPDGFASIADNLVDNAIRYIPAGGRVEVRLEQIGEAVRFVVRDDGPGIPLAERERVFERFYRIPGSVADGSGLGLSIVARIVASHRATLRFVDGLADRGLGLEVVIPV